MSDPLNASDFPAFYAALHSGREPFPWQRMLAERIEATGWPEGIDLPTASGKTACLDVAVFSLACQADRLPIERTTPRRVFYIVDRRIVVDAAHEHARVMANALAEADSGILARVAQRLRQLQGEDTADPLYAARLRGGAVRDDGWADSPAQAAIVSGTVDQVGSRLLFRGFGPGQLTAPIHAGLIANDSLLLLDEAHCAVPFLQTARAVADYRRSAAAQPLAQTPFSTTVMSATPPESIPDRALFPSTTERDAALDHPALDKRLRISKPATLVRSKRAPKNAASDNDPLVEEAVQRAEAATRNGCSRIAIMVNRVKTARTIKNQLMARGAEQSPPAFETELLTGRMRPLDRDRILERWQLVLRADAPTEPDRPVILVTTQCLEVGADFSFDALVTECASLDALRQRFGRLNRLGNANATEAAILIRSEQAKKSDDDPIYGTALAATWHWLNQQGEAVASNKEEPTLDFGALPLDQRLEDDPAGRPQRERELAAPTKQAPVTLPAHLDAFVQTAPRPAPDPDVSVFLHGPDSSAPEVNLAFRADLAAPDYADDDLTTWFEALSFVPPASAETIAVPLWLVKRILGRSDGAEPDIPDVEGAAEPETGAQRRQPRSRTPVMLWRGRRDSKATRNLSEIQPNDTVVIPTSALSEVADALLDRPTDAPLDVADAAAGAAGRPVLRVHPQTLPPPSSDPAMVALLSWAAEPHRAENPGELDSLLEAIGDATALPTWLREIARTFVGNHRVVEHPETGYILVPRQTTASGEHDPDADVDDLTSRADRALTLSDHLSDVEATARQFGSACLPPDLAESVAVAAWLHDIGKADPRFQTMLHGGNEFARYRAPEALAKGTTMPASQHARRRARELSRLPDRFRHEMLSLQLLEQHPECLPPHCDAELIQHLIASHHGFGRPFAPISEDRDPPSVRFTTINSSRAFTFDLLGEQRAALVPPHRLDSGVSERFWRLIRRYGWWGLAYLEAMLRLADWRASATGKATTAPTNVEEQELSP